MRFDLAIFDLDGTLVDSAPDIARALNATLVEAGLPPLAVEAAMRLVGDGAANLIARALPPAAQHLDIQFLLKRFLAHYGEHLCDDTRLYPGVASLLLALQERGMRAAVITNKNAGTARALLAAMGVAGRFIAVIGDGEGFPRKPDPAAAHALLAREAIPPARVVMIGDGLPDVRLAHAIPCASIAATWGYVSAERLVAEAPTFTAASPAAVLELLA